MSRYFFLSLCVCFSVAQAAEKTTPNEAHDLAYSLGASLGERLRQEVPDLQLQALLDGLQQAYQGKPLALKDEQIEQILAEHEAQVAEQPALPQSEVALEKEQRFLTEEKAKPGVRELADGILLTELAPGTGAKAGPDGKVEVLYVGRLPDGTVFDQNSKPQWFSLDSVISGWRSALQNMPVGAKWRLVIPSSQAYGADGAGDLIAPFTPLVFEVELRGATS
ncbi:MULTISPECIES: FKBP-type peptidyl-prolyl cis-trans isomerase [Pseudomonas]|jgi:peptidylprolyl isomerase/FKBP-type peptidyl-prolyl cis-trans isomerase FklB|uniref:Peptidyl-prolyl cis-trans isomerase n=3 Tax=Pseudomonas fluorescens group TaxID=136843 RepID=A0AB36CV21_9PSED|nr:MULTISPECIES: FKBP-type peptidyl-prolyl cis-trans isomerase [Pseudomonas]MBU0524317.1 FKBP-type peptidyl-prolyl cis-trans isomerase [Gammaproteobacteria bacterium]MDF9884182.1 peptidylprolyl isomerase/FKBP-type peptidyl-prolyl cis-trans isomerase FklB [Pseudomonas silensiensis]AHZ70764.1 peptidylprolyl isomerase, FKBP-type [Pseudomonas mandelii JR-1]MBA4360448.1 FKBP-type peptidyl-prolyl cis-trans isomerase [Pseudomonas sp.]MBU0820273.1 FKBP-type peptidyl-prolyl cis-trans isomerase [Gammapr